MPADWALLISQQWILEFLWSSGWFPRAESKWPLERQGYREGASLPSPPFLQLAFQIAHFHPFFHIFMCVLYLSVYGWRLHTCVDTCTCVYVHACGGLRLMSEHHIWWLIHLIHRGRVSHINPELANMASLLPLPNLPDRNYSLAAMLTWQFVGFWESKLCLHICAAGTSVAKLFPKFPFSSSNCKISRAITFCPLVPTVTVKWFHLAGKEHFDT